MYIFISIITIQMVAVTRNQINMTLEPIRHKIQQSHKTIQRPATNTQTLCRSELIVHWYQPSSFGDESGQVSADDSLLVPGPTKCHARRIAESRCECGLPKSVRLNSQLMAMSLYKENIQPKTVGYCNIQNQSLPKGSFRTI